MYAGSGFELSELGDVDVVRVDGTYHLFHLVLPNHDYIAHAVSEEGLLWRRTRNALFVGDPGSWDDDMLWTMHVSAAPDRTGAWRMFYTGLSRRERGRVQRIGLARSEDLMNWEKDTSGSYPLSVGGYYEKSLSEGREWVSFRDPFFFIEGDTRLLLANARVAQGPVIRRGCVAALEEAEPDRFTFRPALFLPFMYDDVEVPSLYNIGGTYYLIGSLREDVKIHYWHANTLYGHYEAFYDNVLLPQGNYAARFLKESDDRYTVWNFFFDRSSGEGQRLLPPPKELAVADDGRLLLQSFKGFDARVSARVALPDLLPVTAVFGNRTAASEADGQAITIETRSGYEVFLLDPACDDFRLGASLVMQGKGKTGLVFRMDAEGNGYFVSLDMVNGLAQVRAWGRHPQATFNNAFLYHNMQQNHFPANPRRAYDVMLLVFGGYIELSIDGYIVLSLIDTTFTEGRRLGFYVESAAVRVADVRLDVLKGPRVEDYGPL